MNNQCQIPLAPSNYSPITRQSLAQARTLSGQVLLNLLLQIRDDQNLIVIVLEVLIAAFSAESEAAGRRDERQVKCRDQKKHLLLSGLPL